MNRYAGTDDRASLDRLLARQAVSLWAAHEHADELSDLRAAALWRVFASSVSDAVERAEQIEAEYARSRARHPAGKGLPARCGEPFAPAPDLALPCSLPPAHSGSHAWEPVR